MRTICPLSFQANPPKGSLPAIIYTLAAALSSFIGTSQDDLSRSWIERTKAAARFTRILHKLLALVTCMHPKKLGQASFSKLRPRPESAGQSPKAPATPATSRPKAPRRPFAAPPLSKRIRSARQVAARLATLLRDLHVAARETGLTLPKNILALCARAATKAGCHALPPRNLKAKLGFFAEIMTLPPWHPLLL